jgi:succinate dehydrogenase / fumarate reductase cytochrome b subunit
MLRSDNGAAFDIAVKFMGNPVMKVMEIVLFGGIILHILYAFILTITNMIARPVGYAVSNNSQKSFFSKYMVHTGIIILVFLGLHFINFYFVKLGWVSIPTAANGNKHDFYSMAIALFQNPIYSTIYIGFMILLSFHLNHAFQSAFQTLGFNHKTYSPIINAIGTIYSIIIPFGFAIIPIYFLFFFKA